jgi:dTDP-4-dehydrorhamnose reductase
MSLTEKYGVYHATNEGFCSWAEFAEEIMRRSGSECKIIPIPSEQYPTKAARPKNSKLSKTSLDNTGFKRLPDWQDALANFF